MGSDCPYAARVNSVHRAPLVLFVTLAALAAACGGGDADGTVEAAPEPTATVAVDAEPSSQPTVSAPAEPTTQPTEVEAPQTTPTALPSPTPEPAPEPTPTTGPLCAALLPGAERVHPSDRGTPVADVDGDGADDEFWMTEPVDFGPAAVQVVRSSDGAVSVPLELGAAFHLFDAVLAASDVDADGLDEVFWSLSGNTLLSGVILELVGCELRAVATEDVAFDDGDGTLTYAYFAGGNGCAPTGCYYSVTCVPGDGVVDIVFTSIYPRVSVLDPQFDESALDAPLDDQEVMFSQVTVVVVDGVGLVVDATEEVPVRLGDIPEWRSRPEVGCD